MNEPRIDIVDQDHCLAYWHNVFIQVWRNNPTEKLTRAMRASGRRFLDTTRGEVGSVVVIEDGCPVPDNQARVHTVGFLGDLRQRGRGIALVFEGEGFRAAATRAAMVGLMTAARFPFPYKVVRDPIEAEAFMRPFLPEVGKGIGELGRAVAIVRSRIPQRLAS
jgi:hypothetical protein